VCDGALTRWVPEAGDVRRGQRVSSTARREHRDAGVQLATAPTSKPMSRHQHLGAVTSARRGAVADYTPRSRWLRRARRRDPLPPPDVCQPQAPQRLERSVAHGRGPPQAHAGRLCAIRALSRMQMNCACHELEPARAEDVVSTANSVTAAPTASSTPPGRSRQDPLPRPRMPEIRRGLRSVTVRPLRRFGSTASRQSARGHRRGVDPERGTSSSPGPAARRSSMSEDVRRPP